MLPTSENLHHVWLYCNHVPNLPSEYLSGTEQEYFEIVDENVRIIIVAQSD
jgi:hypothetical protein